jgi:hypothetical protein
MQFLITIRGTSGTTKCAAAHRLRITVLSSLLPLGPQIKTLYALLPCVLRALPILSSLLYLFCVVHSRKYYCNMLLLRRLAVSSPDQTPSCRTTHFRLSATAYSVYFVATSGGRFLHLQSGNTPRHEGTHLT